MEIAPIPPFPALSDRANGTYNGKAFDWASHMANTFVTEVNALAANLNSIAAGGAYALPYIFNSPAAAIGGAVGTTAGGHLAFSNEATVLLIDTKSLQGVSVKPILNSIATATSSFKGTLRIVKQNDPSTWAIYNITSYVEDAGGRYGYFAVSYVLENGLFAENDPVILHLQRTGDKGDTGPAYVPKIMLIRDQKGPGVNPQTIPANVWTARDINTVSINQIPDAYVSGNKVRLPPGKFWIEAVVPVMQSGSFVARLFNVTSNGMHDMGTSGFAATGGSPSSTYSLISSFFESTVPHEFRIEHLVGITAPGGSAHPSEVNSYTQIKITQVG